MPVKIHRQIFRILNFGSQFAPAFASAIFAILAMKFDLVGIAVAFGLLLVLAPFILHRAFLRFVPAYCDAPGCKGLARPRWTKRPVIYGRDVDHKEYLKYICDTCGMNYDTRISKRPDDGRQPT